MPANLTLNVTPILGEHLLSVEATLTDCPEHCKQVEGTTFPVMVESIEEAVRTMVTLVGTAYTMVTLGVDPLPTEEQVKECAESATVEDVDAALSTTLMFEGRPFEDAVTEAIDSLFRFRGDAD